MSSVSQIKWDITLLALFAGVSAITMFHAAEISKLKSEVHQLKLEMPSPQTYPAQQIPMTSPVQENYDAVTSAQVGSNKHLRQVLDSLRDRNYRRD